MQKCRIHNRPELKYARKQLRNHATAAEAVLWLQLKQKQLDGRKFRRQHSVGNYVLDFYCPSEKLAIELDGDAHFWEPHIGEDEARTRYLNSFGIRVIRFENKWVFEDMVHVLQEIRKFFEER